jgi:hypothetical protein
MDAKQILAMCKKRDELNRSGMANVVLACLRHIRDNSPAEWDELMKSESGAVMTELWDYLKAET